MPASASDRITDTFNSANPNVARVTSSRTAGVTTLACDNLAGWPTVSKVHFSTYQIDTNNAVVAGTQIDWEGIVSGNSIGSLVRKAGATDSGSSVGDVVEMNPTGSWGHDLYLWGTQEHNKDGTHAAITATSIVTTGNGTIGGTLAVTGNTTGPLANSVNSGWVLGLAAPNTVAYNGNRNYTLTFNSTDLTGTLSSGMRLRTTRNTAAPTQCTSLNGSTQYWSKSSPSAMTFTDDFVASAWIKLSAYSGSDQIIASRYNGTSGWSLSLVATTGQVMLRGYNAGSGNVSQVISYQSVPLNRWVHVAAQLDMSAFTATTTTSYVMFDGLDVPASVARAGTNPTALVQAGNLEIGSQNAGTLPFNGKIAQVAIFNAKVTQATIRGYISQGLSGSETSLISAYSFNNSANDLNANANNLSANGSAVATNADSPFGTQASGSISSTLDYGIIMSASFSTNTTVVVQVPEGCTIPTSGTVSALAYSVQKAPYGFLAQRSKWQIQTISKTAQSISTGTSGAFVASNHSITMPIGSWVVWHAGEYGQNNSSVGNFDFKFRLSGASAGAIDDSQTTCYLYSSGTDYATFQMKDCTLELSAQEVYTVQSAATAGAGTTTTRIVGNVPAVIKAENAYL